MSTDSTLMSVREAARRLGVHDNTVRRYVDRGWIRAVRLPSGVRRVRREDIEALAPSAVSSARPDEDPPRSVDELAADQRTGPLRSLSDLFAAEIWRSDEELEEFLTLTYAERGRDR